MPLLDELCEALLGAAADPGEVPACGEGRARAGEREHAERAVGVRVPARQGARGLVDREQLVTGDRGRAGVLTALHAAVVVIVAADVDQTVERRDRLDVAVGA